MGQNKKIVPPASEKLADIEKENERTRREKISRIALEIEKIFIANNLTMGDLTEVMDLFNSRAQAVFSSTKLLTVKEKYERLNR